MPLMRFGSDLAESSQKRSIKMRWQWNSNIRASHSNEKSMLQSSIVELFLPMIIF